MWSERFERASEVRPVDPHGQLVRRQTPYGGRGSAPAARPAPPSLPPSLSYPEGCPPPPKMQTMYQLSMGLPYYTSTLMRDRIPVDPRTRAAQQRAQEEAQQPGAAAAAKKDGNDQPTERTVALGDERLPTKNASTPNLVAMKVNKPEGRTYRDFQPPPMTPTTRPHAAGKRRPYPLDRYAEAKDLTKPVTQADYLPQGDASSRGEVDESGRRVPSQRDCPAGFYVSPLPLQRRSKEAVPQRYRDPGEDTHEIMRMHTEPNNAAGIIGRGFPQPYHDSRHPPKQADLDSWHAQRVEEQRIQEELKQPTMEPTVFTSRID